MTSEEMKEAIDILIEAAQTNMILIDHRQRLLLQAYAVEMSRPGRFSDIQ